MASTADLTLIQTHRLMPVVSSRNRSFRRNLVNRHIGTLKIGLIV